MVQVIIFIIILTVFIVWLCMRQQIRYWVELFKEKGWVTTVHFDRCSRILRRLYHDINPAAISMEARKKQGLSEDPTYTHGEVTFYSFVNILEMADPKAGEVFYDLGSGSGKAVFIAGLAFDFKKACGVEKLDDLYNLSMTLLAKLKNEKNNISFIHGDFLSQDITDGDVIFINATCFRGQMFHDIITKLRKLKPGTRIIFGSANLAGIGGFELIYCNLHLMSWGLSTVRIYRRI
jgi:SAM-dependent methyltransferase